MADTSGLITIRQLVRKTIFQNKLKLSDYLRYYWYVVDAFRELNLHHLHYVKTVKLDMDTDIKTIDFPSDFLKFISLSLPYNGRMFTFTADNRLLTTTTGGALDASYGEGIDIDEGIVIGYGARGGKNNYYYTTDEENRRWVITGLVAENVIVRYVSSGVSLTGETQIPMDTEQAIQAYIVWKEYESDDSKKKWEKERKEYLYDVQVNMLRILKLPPLDAIRDAIYKTIYQGMKR